MTTTLEEPALVAAESTEQAQSRQAGVLSAATIVVSAANYGLSLLVIRFLSDAAYGRFVSAQGLLLVLGSGCMSAIPWAVARHVALDRSRRAASEALHFGLRAAVVQGVALAAIAGGVLAPIGGWALASVGAVAAFMLSLVAAPVGFLQGEQRLVSVAVLRVLETVVRVGISVVLLVLFSGRDVAALVGFPLGSALVVVGGLALCGRARPLRRGDAALVRALLRQSVLLGLIQLALASLSALDTVAVQFAGVSDASVSAYDVASVLGRIPLFLSTAISVVYYQQLTRARDDREAAAALRPALDLYVRIVAPAAVLLVTAPVGLVRLIAHDHAAEVTHLLYGTVVSGFLIGAMNVLSTAHQARGRFRPAIAILGAGAVAQPFVLVLAGRLGGIGAYAAALAVVSLVVLVVLLVDGRRWSPWPRVPWTVSFAGVLGMLAAVVSLAVPALWPVAVLVLGAVAVTGVTGVRARRRGRHAR